MLPTGAGARAREGVSGPNERHVDASWMWFLQRPACPQHQAALETEGRLQVGRNLGPDAVMSRGDGRGWAAVRCGSLQARKDPVRRLLNERPVTARPEHSPPEGTDELDKC